LGCQQKIVEYLLAGFDKNEVIMRCPDINRPEITVEMLLTDKEVQTQYLGDILRIARDILLRKHRKNTENLLKEVLNEINS
jgi:hypothetical protein